MAFLDSISTPNDIRSLSVLNLSAVAGELRQEILHTVSLVGGHLSSNLGSIELTVALHHVFDTPVDRLVWDVGHQTYAHKILTGRRHQLANIRRRGGISGFPQRNESEYDSFGTAHASTSISAALGMAIANARAGHHQKQVVAIIGDGALSGGMALEALNNAYNAYIKAPFKLLVILNDNEMSISPAVGAINRYLRRLVLGSKIKPAKATETDKIKAGSWFKMFGFDYTGPIDGHDMMVLVKTLSKIKQSSGLQFLHVVTVKGKGFEKAENDPVLYHGVGQFEPKKGIAPMKVEKGATIKPTYTKIFSDWLVFMAREDSRLLAITPAMGEGSGLVEFSQTFPNRYFDVGIAEQHAVTFAAGVACEQMKPVVAIYSTFLQRAYDQLIHDVALQNLPVVFAIDRGGLVGADGPTHHGAFDLSFLRCIPNLTVMTPSNEGELWLLLNTAYKLDTPSAVRYPRGNGCGVSINKNLQTVPIGQGVVRRQGKDIALLGFGPLVDTALSIAKELDATLVDMRFVKPLDTALVRQLSHQHQYLVTIEENVISGGAGSMVSEYCRSQQILNPILHIGLPDCFISHGQVGELLSDCGLDSEGILRQIKEFKHSC